jgi:DNA ligase-1
MTTMLAKLANFDKVDVSGWYGSTKLDGYRAKWKNGKLFTRNDNVYSAPKSFTDLLPRDTELDGELVIPRVEFEAHGALRRKDETDPVWNIVEYHVFALPNSGLPFEKVITSLERLRFGSDRIKVCVQTVIDNNAQAQELAQMLINDGKEGLMLREPSSVYERRRSSNLLKVKGVLRSEARIVGYKNGKGRNAERVGALLCQFIRDDEKDDGDDNRNFDKSFGIGGLIDKMRDNPPEIGTVVVAEYQNLSKNGLPRHPRLYQVK